MIMIDYTHTMISEIPPKIPPYVEGRGMVVGRVGVDSHGLGGRVGPRVVEVGPLGETGGCLPRRSIYTPITQSLKSSSHTVIHNQLTNLIHYSNETTYAM
jgi:hypothetical protein